MRRFEHVKPEEFLKRYPGGNAIPQPLPARGTAFSAGYDFRAPEDIEIPVGGMKTIWTGMKAYMNPGEVFMIFPRSSMGKKGIKLANTVGIIDADYADNPSNDGDIGVMLENFGTAPYIIHAGDKICQGIFTQYLICDGERDITTDRTGGFGSTGE